MNIDPSPAQERSSRKHFRSSDFDDYLDWSSDESGRFDDAEEPDMEDYKSPSAKSVKRRRSNDWPLPDEAADYGHHDRRNARGANGSLGANLVADLKASPRASPRASATSLRGRHSAAASNSPRNRLGRRSRFVEATMSDSVSEKPPSILFRDSKQAGAQNRGSGIFRFGKAIASAFNPFGGWGKSSPENPSKSPQKDALSQAEEAYAELKKAGFKGTDKGAYMQSQCVDQTHADQTWQAIQEKMGYGNPTLHCGGQENPGTPSRSPSKVSKRSSFQDIRSLGLPFIKSHEQSTTDPSTYHERTSEDSETTALRKQKSRKELSRQAKLLKKVNNLEDKLDRARRELRQLTGNEERLPAPTPGSKRMSMEMDPGSYPRKFVPGALPTLPSERLLDQQALMSESPETEPAQMTALPSMESRASTSIEEPPPASTTAAKPPKRRLREPRPSSMGKESSSRKRKSPIPEPLASGNSPQPSPTDCIDVDADGPPPELAQLIDFGLLSSPRQAKWQKFEADDSPGSVERKRNMILDLDHGSTATEAGSMHKRSPSVQPRRPSPGLHRSPNSKAVRSSPPLRMRRGRSNLRPSVSPSLISVPDSDPATDNWLSPSPPSNEAHRSFYLQQHRQLDPDRTPRSSPSKPSLSRKRSRQDEDIPPVPPLPKELLMNAAKVTESPTKKQSSRKEQAAGALEPQSSSAQNRQFSGTESYPWPDDIF